MNRRNVLSMTAAACGGWLLKSAHAQPTGLPPVSVVIPFAPGGASDIVVRALADGLARELGRPVVTDNKGGAGGLIAAAAVGRAAPDGQTLLYGNQGQMVVARHLFPANGSDPRAVLMPLTLTARTQFFLVVPAGSPATSVKALLGTATGALKVGIPGVGSPPHLASVLLAERTGVAVDVIPYQGSAPLLVDLIAGRLDAAFDNVASSMAQVRAGKLRALAVSGPSRAGPAPDIPTVAESGIEGYAYQSWQGVFGPKGMPADVVARTLTGLHRALDEPAVRQRLLDLGLEIATGSPAAFEALVNRDAEEWDARVRKGLIRPA
jgi:tripartite-type tricarboxylate transporter receptor subunit TctC